MFLTENGPSYAMHTQCLLMRKFLQISHMSGFVDLRVVEESGFVRGCKLNLYKQHRFFSIIADEAAAATTFKAFGSFGGNIKIKESTNICWKMPQHVDIKITVGALHMYTNNG